MKAGENDSDGVRSCPPSITIVVKAELIGSHIPL
jgi:hypothetical protein